MQKAKVWRQDILCFIREMFGEEADPLQAEVLRSIQNEERVAVRSGHGTGKTWLASRAGLWFFTTHPESKVLITAPTWRQVEKVFWAEIHARVHQTMLATLAEFQKAQAFMKIPRKNDGKKRTPAEHWFMTGISSDAPENFQGFHGRYVMFIVDEASGVMDEIFDAIEACRATGESKILVIGNPTRPTGRFYEIFHPRTPHSPWVLHHLSCLKSPRVNPKWVEEKKREWGEDSNLYRVRVLGEFPHQADDALFSLHLLEKSRREEEDAPAGFALKNIAYSIGVDVARFGEDKTVLTVVEALRIPGESSTRYRVREIYAYEKLPVSGTVNMVLDLIERMVKSAESITILVDDTGLGGGVTDLLHRELEVRATGACDIRVMPVVFGSAPIPQNSFAQASLFFSNLKAQLVWNVKTLFESGNVEISGDILPDWIDLLFAQLLDIRYEFTAGGRLQVIDPPGKSPDFAHSLALALASALLQPLHPHLGVVKLNP